MRQVWYHASVSVLERLERLAEELAVGAAPTVVFSKVQELISAEGIDVSSWRVLTEHVPETVRHQLTHRPACPRCGKANLVERKGTRGGFRGWYCASQTKGQLCEHEFPVEAATSKAVSDNHRAERILRDFAADGDATAACRSALEPLIAMCRRWVVGEPPARLQGSPEPEFGPATIFDIRQHGAQPPFVVQRWQSRACLLYVETVSMKARRALGWPLPPGPPICDREYPVNPFYGESNVSSEIVSAGERQWILLDKAQCPEAWNADLKLLVEKAYNGQLARFMLHSRQWPAF